MATGTIKWFNQALHDLGNKVHDLDGDDLRLGIVTNSAVPSPNTSNPHWNGTGTNNFATNQVQTNASGSYTGPIALANKTWTNVGGTVPTFRADVVTLPQDTSGFGFTNGAFGIVYNNTDPQKRAIGFVELNAGGAASVVSGQLVIDWSGANNDILTLAQS